MVAGLEKFIVAKAVFYFLCYAVRTKLHLSLAGNLNTILRVPPAPSLLIFQNLVYKYQIIRTYKWTDFLLFPPPTHQKPPGGCNRTWRRIPKGSEHTAPGDPAAKLCRKPLNICKCKKCEKFILMMGFWQFFDEGAGGGYKNGVRSGRGVSFWSKGGNLRIVQQEIFFFTFRGIFFQHFIKYFFH